MPNQPSLARVPDEFFASRPQAVEQRVDAILTSAYSTQFGPHRVCDQRDQGLLARLAEWFDRSIERARQRELEADLAHATNARDLSQRIHRAELEHSALAQ
jgi:hypothetical protein